MASDETKSTLETERSTVPGSCATKSYWMAQVVLRLVLSATTKASIWVMVTSKQKKTILGHPLPTVKFTSSPAFIYFEVALSVACFYSVVSTFSSVVAIRKPSTRSAGRLLILAIVDAVMMGIVASATGAGGGVAYIGLKGNKEGTWPKICHIYGKYCRHIGASIGLSLASSIILLLLSIISIISLYKKIR